MLIIVVACVVHASPRLPLLAGLYPEIPDTEAQHRPPVAGVSAARQVVFPAKERDIAPGISLSTALMLAIGLCSSGATSAMVVWSSFPSLRPTVATAKLPSVVVVAAAVLVPAVSCLSVQKSLGSQSVALYLSGMATAISYGLWLFLRFLKVHHWHLTLLTHVCLCLQPIVCCGLGWMLNSLDEVRSTRRGHGSVRCWLCSNLFVPPAHAPVVACPFCGTQNRV